MRTLARPALLRRLRSLTRPDLRGLAGGWQAAAVWVFWAAAVVLAAGYVARHGHNIPTDDEWAFVPVSYAPAAEQFRWLGAKHIEHRFPLGRVLNLALLRATGHDYRVGMWVTVGFLAATAALLVIAARNLRGRTVLADAAFPLLFLHVGHTENLLMGYQVVFTLTVLALGAFALVVSRAAEARPGTTALAGALCLFVVANGGWQGLLFVPFVGLWVASRAWRAVREPGERGRGLAAIAVAAVVAGYLAWSAWVLLEERNGAKGRGESPGTDARVRAVCEAVGIGIGVARSTDAAGVANAGRILLGVQAVAALGLAVVALRRPDRRPLALGLLALLLGVWAFALGIGYGRGSGYASRYTTFTALGVAVPCLLLAGFARWSAWPMAVVVAAFGSHTLPGNVRHAKNEGAMMDRRHDSILADVRTGMPIDVLADRHNDFCFSTHAGWFTLWKEKFRPLKRVPAPAENPDAVTLKPRRDGEQAVEGARLNRYRVDFDGEKRVSFVRVRFTPKTVAMWEVFVFEWTDPATGEKRRSVVRGWTRPNPMQTAFWIDGPVASGELFIGRPGCPITLDSVECVACPGANQR